MPHRHLHLHKVGQLLSLELEREAACGQQSVAKGSV